MVILLLLTTFVIAFVIATIVVMLFNKPITNILNRVVPPDLGPAWAKYLKFALYVAGIGGGVRVWSFEKYLMEVEPYKEVVELTSYRWALEVYETIIGTLSSASIVLLVFFVFALVAVVIVRIYETRTAKGDEVRSTALVAGR